jgi:hypothetical protein
VLPLVWPLSAFGLAMPADGFLGSGDDIALVEVLPAMGAMVLFGALSPVGLDVLAEAYWIAQMQRGQAS